MNKILITLMLTSILVFSVAIVSAENIAPRDGTGVDHDAVIAAGGQNGTGVGDGTGVRAMVQDGTYMNQNGQQIQVQNKEGNRVQLKVGNREAGSNLEITSSQENGKTKMMAKLSNGRNAEIKVMPDAASETALQRLRLRNCNESNNCSLELKQVGQGDQARLAYEVQVERHSRVLGLFSAKMQVNAQVDAESGETIGVGKPWWAFLATEPEEQ